MIPADTIVLGSEFESGVCYIETSSLDGEKNLKPKSALKETQAIFQNLGFRPNGEIIFEAKGPNPNLYEFEASLQLPSELQKK
jgi:phospholipid-transporting ATPase